MFVRESSARLESGLSFRDVLVVFGRSKCFISACMLGLYDLR